MLATTRSVHRGRDPRGGRHQARLASRAHARAHARSLRCRLQRVGLSATQKPIEEVARFLVRHPAGGRCRRVRHRRQRPRARSRHRAGAAGLAARGRWMSTEVWATLYDKLAALVSEHRTTLIFANTRRMVERVTRHLSERLGAECVAAHHGSLAKEQRLDAEQRLKSGQLRALVATASLELGIDIGDVELVCQLSTPRSIATFLQRVGTCQPRRRRRAQGPPVPLSRDELVECTALLDAVRAGELDRLHTCRSRRWTCCRSRSCRRWPPASVARTSCSRSCAVHGRIATWSAAPTTSSCACSRTALAHAPWPAERVPASRRRQQAPARAARRASHRAHVRRRHPAERGLPGGDGAAGRDGRHVERRLCGREPRGRRVPARQPVVSHPARGGRQGARGRRGGSAAHHSVLARRSARAHRRAVHGPSRGCARKWRTHYRTWIPPRCVPASRSCAPRISSAPAPRSSWSSISPPRRPPSGACPRASCWWW